MGEGAARVIAFVRRAELLGAQLAPGTAAGEIVTGARKLPHACGSPRIRTREPPRLISAESGRRLSRPAGQARLDWSAYAKTLSLRAGITSRELFFENI